MGKPIDESRDTVPPKESAAIAREPKEGPDVLPLTGSLHGDRVDLFTGSVFRWREEGTRWVISVDRWTNVVLRPALGHDRHHYEAVLVDRRQAGPIALTLQPMPMDWAMGVAEDWLRNHGGSTIRKDDPTRDSPPTAKQQTLAAELGITWPDSTTREVASHLIDQAPSKPGPSLTRARVGGMNRPRNASVHMALSKALRSPPTRPKQRPRCY